MHGENLKLILGCHCHLEVIVTFNSVTDTNNLLRIKYTHCLLPKFLIFVWLPDIRDSNPRRSCSDRRHIVVQVAIRYKATRVNVGPGNR